jgi:glycosyltransferase involved in cell wall biosynthesis
LPELRAVIFGDGPQRDDVLTAVVRRGLDGIVDAPGFVDGAIVEEAIGRALCLVLPSRREGYGLVVLEALSRGTPVVLVAGDDNAALEFVINGVNGFVVDSPDAEAIASARVHVAEAGWGLRDSTVNWFRANATRLSLESSLGVLAAGY